MCVEKTLILEDLNVWAYMPSHSIVVGVPAKIIKKRDNINQKWEKKLKII